MNYNEQQLMVYDFMEKIKVKEMVNGKD